MELLLLSDVHQTAILGHFSFTNTTYSKAHKEQKKKNKKTCTYTTTHKYPDSRTIANNRGDGYRLPEKACHSSNRMSRN